MAKKEIKKKTTSKVPVKGSGETPPIKVEETPVAAAFGAEQFAQLMEQNKAVLKGLQTSQSENAELKAQLSNLTQIVGTQNLALEKLKAGSSKAVVGAAPKWTPAKVFKATVKGGSTGENDVQIKFKNGFVKRNEIIPPVRAFGSDRFVTIDKLIADHIAGECPVGHTKTALQIMYDRERVQLRDGKKPGYFELITSRIAA